MNKKEVKKKERAIRYATIGIIVIVILIIIGFLIKSYFFKEKETAGFETDTIFLKINMAETGVSSNNINVINHGLEKKHFSAILKNFDIGSIEDSEFDLNPEEEKNIKIVFKTEKKEPGIYTGELYISSGFETRKIPVLVEIHSNEVLFHSNINIFPLGKDIVLGQKVNAEIKVFDLSNIGRSNVNFLYYIKDFEGKTLLSESEALVVDGRLDFSKTFDLSKNVGTGDYVLGVIVKYKESIGASSLFLKIVDTQESTIPGKYLVFIIGIFVFLFFICFMIFMYSLLYRDRLLNELKNQYKSELRNQRQIINRIGKKECLKLKGKKEKKIYMQKINKIKRKRLNVLREIHAKRLKEFKRIRKKGNRNQLINQIKKWREQGYDTGTLDEKYRYPTVSEIKNKVQKWKKQGYDTRVLK